MSKEYLRPEVLKPTELPKPPQSTATHGDFLKSLVMELHRPKSMPYNKAACDSSSGKYDCGRFEFQACISLEDSWENFTERLYRKQFGTLAGSNRTSRLRKKRRDAINRWVDNWLYNLYRT